MKIKFNEKTITTTERTLVRIITNHGIAQMDRVITVMVLKCKCKSREQVKWNKNRISIVIIEDG